MICSDGTIWEPSEEQIKEWRGAYPGCNVTQELKQMSVWLNSNPAKRKTQRGMPRFVNNWLSRANVVGGSNQTARPIPPLYKPAESRPASRETVEAWTWYIATYLCSGVTAGLFKPRVVDDETRDKYIELVNAQAKAAGMPEAILDEHKIVSVWGQF